MSAVNLDVRYVAHLARLELTLEEEQRLGAQLGQILGYIDQLKGVDVTGVEPMAHAVPLVNVVRADASRPSLSHADAMRNAPVRADGLFIVPRIVD